MIEVDLPPKVEALIVRTPTCWFFIGSLSDDGYPTMQLGSGSTLRTARVHRHVCELQWGRLGETEKAYDIFAAAAETHALKVVLQAVPVENGKAHRSDELTRIPPLLPA